MEKKEKLKIFFKEDDISFEKVVIEKINEIIDHLNSQSQPEEIYPQKAKYISADAYREELLAGEDTPEECEHKYILETHPFGPFGLSRIRCPKCGDTRDIEDFLKGEDTQEEDEIEANIIAEQEAREDIFEDTTEEWAVWVLRDVESWIDLGFESHFENRITRKIQQLLEDREREVLQEIIGMAKTMAKDYYSGNTQLYLDVRNVQDKLDKLNNKKK